MTEVLAPEPRGTEAPKGAKVDSRRIGPGLLVFCCHLLTGCCSGLLEAWGPCMLLFIEYRAEQRRAGNEMGGGANQN